MADVILDRRGTVTSYARHDRATGTMFLQDVQDCGEVMRRCAAERAEDRLRRFRKTADMGQCCLAEIPLVLVDALKAQGLDILGNRDDLRRFLNDPQWAAFRCSTGRV